ncbi:serine hydrolase [Labedella endophytica]|uniref:Serine hydrolase n=1 Tax=Labedella endophytica TaxID=1523160 RepID=A0A433JQT9_9MICO|nr:serine hydrolase [Labedella endophytica]RUQ98981.1 serine hydrolase [Labedella endophytica]
MSIAQPRRPITNRPIARPPRRKGALAGALAVVSALLLSACTPAGDDEASPAPSAVSIPDTPVGEQVSWTLDALNGEIDPTAAEIEERLNADMLAAVTGEQLVDIVDQLAAGEPWTPTSYEGTETQAVSTIVSDSQGSLDLQASVDADGLISGLLFQPTPADRTPAASWDELEENVEALDVPTSLRVTEVTGGETGDVVLSVGDDAAQPLGSIFKLYVLGAVVAAIEDGRIAWDDSLEITDDLKSLPSGELQDEESGTTVTVQEAAEKMIAISDNTATDMLMDAVGRESVEQALADMGHSDPSLNTPFPSTRALFQIGWGDDGALRDAWRDGDEAERRALLDALPGGLIDVEPTALVDAVWIDGVDWFASPDDLVAAHLALQELADTEAGGPVRDILSANPGFAPEVVDPFDYVAFKGGSSVGVLAGSWYVEKGDEAYVITLQSSTENPGALVDQALYFGQAQDAMALLAG